MRTIRYILLSVIFLTILAAIVYFSARETFLSWGTDAVKDSLRELIKAARSGTYANQCATKGSGGGSVSAEDIKVQLRFTSSSEYVMEAICPQFAFDPIVFAQGSLPEYVVRVPGSSGMVYGGERAGIVLEVFGEFERSASTLFERDLSWLSKRKAVILDEGNIQIVDDAATLQLGSGPVTSCSGYGYACCQSPSELGRGESILGLTDCPESCYAQCVARPMVLAFNPNPFFDDAMTRIVRVQSNTAVEFTVVSDAPSDAGVRAVFEFGDGQTAESSDLETPVTHVYPCAVESCEYVATVQLIDAKGTESAESSISRMLVLVE
jgi:hypothetical protein